MNYQRPVERRDGTKYITLNPRKCKACWICVEACPNSVFGKIDFIFHKHSRIDHAERCKGCQKCLKACPQQAITAYRIYKQKVGI